MLLTLAEIDELNVEVFVPEDQYGEVRVGQATMVEPVEPIAGRTILFPAWLLREVEPNFSAEPGDAGHRFNIGFNLLQLRRQSDESRSPA
jgi:hypothetical protein